VARWKHTKAPSSPAEDEAVGVCRKGALAGEARGNEHTDQPLLLQHVNSARASEGWMRIEVGRSRLVVRTLWSASSTIAEQGQTNGKRLDRRSHGTLPANLNYPHVRSTYRHTLHAKGEGQ
jgi:hypothetical protein